MLNVNAGHFSYLTGSSQKDGYTFLAEKIKAAQSGGGSSAAPAAESAGEEAAPAEAAPKPKAAKGKGFGLKGKGGWVNESMVPPMNERR